ncbi:hypothetical protein [Mycolicibacterium goodii]|uniref:Uncharacterized protein n=1 Tax=Mycolicibacterium goodii TaxID=134601 RepID=A0ABS6HT19_MYCGD|nr:hypothetical protein [Mycolicibacterium goodii]MBU8819038.1 hypothetical protein [Mycolicibacterium goodii]MBU8825786.1 hypothetical protein [Mycolicibacterium goodii]MBU8829803.1 hypothetical protein [Mycolicibacterium goodii]MBU8840828.1 hypothetical protein [Mycolicibacterium goodii]PJK23985.1 hypothetical protein CSX11_02815 [Mycolicibacterium goodii]
MALFLRKLLRIGELPDALRAETEAEGVLFLAEYVPVTRRFSGAIPGKRASGSVSSYAGSVVLTDHRALATLATLPKLAGRTVDQPWSAPQNGAVRAELSAEGLMIEADLGDVDSRRYGHFEGQLSLHYKVAIPEDVLARLPRRSLAFDVGPEYVFRAVGVQYHP